MPTTKNRVESAAQRTEVLQGFSRSSSSASSFTSVVEETEGVDGDDTGLESVSSSGTPHKRDSFLYSTWLDDSVSTTSGGSSPVRWLPPAPLPRPHTVTPPRRRQVGGPCVSRDQDPTGNI